MIYDIGFFKLALKLYIERFGCTPIEPIVMVFTLKTYFGLCGSLLRR